jgi:hypothetical protein
LVDFVEAGKTLDFTRKTLSERDTSIIGTAQRCGFLEDWVRGGAIRQKIAEIGVSTLYRYFLPPRILRLELFIPFLFNGFALTTPNSGC